MAISLKHKFESTVPDQPKPGLVRPSDWNDEHDLTLSSGYLVGRTSPGDGPAESIPVDSFATAAQGSKADSALQSFDVAAAVHTASSKATPVDADELGLVDSEASNVLKKLTWANFKATVKTYYDAVTSTFTNKTLDTAGTGNVLKINGTQVSDKTGTGKVVLDTSPTITDGATISKSAASPLADLKISTTATGSGETHISRFSGQDSTAGGGFIRALFFAAGPLNGGVNDQGQFDVLTESGTIFLFSITSLAGDNGTVLKIYDRSNVIRILLKADPASVSYVSGGWVVGGSTGNGAGNFRSMGSIGTAAPVTVTASTRTVGANESDIIFNTSATHTLTLPSASSNPGRFLFVKTIAAFAVNSASSNVCPISSATPGTAILAATAGKWATLKSDGTNWIVMAAN